MSNGAYNKRELKCANKKCNLRIEKGEVVWVRDKPYHRECSPKNKTSAR